MDTVTQMLFGATVAQAGFRRRLGRKAMVAGALIPLIPAGAGLIIGAYRAAGSWGRLIGVDAAAWVAKTSQHSRWAGSYVWSVIRAGLLAVTAAVCLSALLLAVDIALHWADIIEIYQALNTGVVGGMIFSVFDE